MVPPCASDLVEQRFVRVRIVRDDGQREIGTNEGCNQERHRCGDGDRHDLGGCTRSGNQTWIIFVPAEQTEPRLPERADKREHRQEKREAQRLANRHDAGSPVYETEVEPKHEEDEEEKPSPGPHDLVDRSAPQPSGPLTLH